MEVIWGEGRERKGEQEEVVMVKTGWDGYTYPGRPAFLPSYTPGGWLCDNSRRAGVGELVVQN